MSDLSAVTGIRFAPQGSTTWTNADPAGGTGWRIADNQFIFNWQTKGQITTSRSYVLSVTFKDGSERTKTIEFS